MTSCRCSELIPSFTGSGRFDGYRSGINLEDGVRLRHGLVTASCAKSTLHSDRDVLVGSSEAVGPKLDLSWRMSWATGYVPVAADPSPARHRPSTTTHPQRTPNHRQGRRK